MDFDYRNKVLRKYFNDRNWDKNDEYLLKQKLVRYSTELLPEYPYLIEDEWEVEIGKSDEGKGDLVFANEHDCFAVVEIKYINHKSGGRTSSTRRTTKRSKVKEQAIKYGHIYAKQSSGKVEAFIFTNELEKPCLLETYDVARAVVIGL